MLLYPRSTTLREEPFWGTGLAKASCLHFTHGWPSQFQMLTENPGGLCHRPGPRRLLPAGLRSWLPGQSGDFSLRSLTFLGSRFYGLGLAPLSNWSTFQCHCLGPQKDPTCLNRRQSTQVASSKLLKWPRLLVSQPMVLSIVPLGTRGNMVFISLSFQVKPLRLYSMSRG